MIFVVELQPLPGVDPIRALKGLLKIGLRKYGLRALSIVEKELPKKSDGSKTSSQQSDECGESVRPLPLIHR